MSLAEKFGWHVPMTESLKSLPAAYPDTSSHNFKDLIWSYKSKHSYVADCALLEGDFQQAITSAREVVRASLDYFFGEWRPRVANKLSDNPYDWFCNSPEALFWASSLGDWKAVTALSQFPRVPPKWEWPDHAYFALLGFFLRGESLDDHQLAIEFILSKKKQQTRLLLECLRALSVRDTARFQTAWETYMDHFLKRERKKDQVDLFQSRNGSFYAFAAKHYQLHLSIPERFGDYVVQLPQNR
ncbi:MAG TPA: hypothetical protein VNZ25_04980 [Candidatus Angelobacter sp.]|jgi:hypothetical protein|nr:hypothetical protein [Candidatus Angelobacter sp.]